MESGVLIVYLQQSRIPSSLLVQRPREMAAGIKSVDADADTKITTFKCIIMSSEHPGDPEFRRVKMVHIYIDDQPVLVYYHHLCTQYMPWR